MVKAGKSLLDRKLKISQLQMFANTTPKRKTQMSDTRFVYVASARRLHPVTVAYRAAETINDSVHEIEIDLGASFCSNDDRFNRVLGRDIAEGRLLHRPITRRIPYTPGTSFNNTVISYIRNTILAESTKISSIYSRSNP